LKRRDFPFITLAPWEQFASTPPDEIAGRAQNVAPFEWRGHTFQVAARQVDCGDSLRWSKRIVFASFVGREDEANWVLGSGRYYDEPQTTYGSSRLRLEKRLNRLKQSFSFPFGRVFHFPKGELTPEARWVFIAANGSGCWDNTPFAQPDSLFRLSLGANEAFVEAPALAVRARLLEEVGRPDSDARFALDWPARSYAQRQSLLWQTRRGSVAQLLHVLRCALVVHPPLRDAQAEWIWWLEEGSGLLSCSPVIPPHPEFFEETPRLRAWRRAIFEFFEPTLNRALLQRHVCARRAITSTDTLFEVQSEKTTHHERLESALQLRDWAQDKIAPRKLKLLLGSI